MIFFPFVLFKCVWGLARYCVHTTATWDQFCNIIKKVRNHSDGIFLVFPWLIESRSYKKIKSGTSHITHHTSHITYYIGICKFYKILVINTVVTFNNSSKLILKTFDEYFLMEIITLTIQTPMAGLKSVKPTISRWNKALSEKFGLAQKSWKNLRLVFFLQKWLKKVMLSKIQKNHTQRFFKTLSVMFSDF